MCVCVCVCSLGYLAWNAHASLRLCCIFPHYLTAARFSIKKNTERKMFVLIFSTTFVRNISHSKKNWARFDLKTKMYVGHHVKGPLFLSDFIETWIFSTDFSFFFQRSLNIIFHENPSSESGVVPCRQTDMTKLIVAFGSFVNALKQNRTTE